MGRRGWGWAAQRADHCPQAAAGCRAATVFMQYGIVANYCWLLVEGIYLHNLLVVAVFSERSYFTLYLCIGWGECGRAGSPTLSPSPCPAPSPLCLTCPLPTSPQVHPCCSSSPGSLSSSSTKTSSE